VIVLIADALCHRTMFHDCDDSFPDGDLEGLDSTMVEIWKNHYNDNEAGRVLRTFNMVNDEDFLWNIADASIIMNHK